MVGINGRAWFQPISSGPQSTLGARAFGVDSTQTASQCFFSAWLVEVPGSNHFSSIRPELLGFPRGPSGKEPICHCRRCRFNSWVGKIPWRREWEPTPIFLPGKCCGQRNLVGYSPWGCKESDTTEWLTLLSFSWDLLVIWADLCFFLVNCFLALLYAFLWSACLFYKKKSL